MMYEYIFVYIVLPLIIIIIIIITINIFSIFFLYTFKQFWDSLYMLNYIKKNISFCGVKHNTKETHET
jgi:sterol desaturase/sphingolipid hydroxylase (fatty acid hydroxylase superfamily)